MASDDDVIYVDVAARLDESTAEKASGKLRDKFKGVGKHIGSATARSPTPMLFPT
jgi:hypothetical protein